MNKILKTATLFSILFFGLFSVSFAAPWKSNGADIVNQTGPGDVSIVGKFDDMHHGYDLVMRAGKSKVFHQWFEGEDSSNKVHGDHSVWRPVEDLSECNEDHGWYPVNVGTGYDAAAYGGEDYFEDNSNYCVKTNGYNPAYYLNNL